MRLQIINYYSFFDFFDGLVRYSLLVIHLRILVRDLLIAFVAQLGERKTEDLKVRGSIPRGGIIFNLL